MFFVFVPIYLLLSVSLSPFICLFSCYPLPISIFTKCLYCYCKFWFCNIIFIFINHHPASFISFFHPSIGEEFVTLSSSGMVYLYPSVVLGKPVKVSNLFFVFFVLQKIAFCFCLFVCFKLSLTTTAGVDACLRLLFDII